MKSSHYVTPRTMSEGVWHFNADPIERPEPHRIVTPRWAWYVLGAFIIATFALAATPARATGTPTQPPASPEYSVDAAATAGAAAQAGSVATGVGLGGGGGAGGTGTGGNASSTSGGSYAALNGGSTRTTVAVLPQPVWTMVPQAAGCITTSARSASVGWSLVSVARSDQASDPACVGIIMAKAAYDHCHFASEQMIMARIYETLFPGKPALPLVPDARNHTLAECEDMKRPRLTLAPVLHTPPPAPVAPVARAPRVDRQ